MRTLSRKYQQKRKGAVLALMVLIALLLSITSVAVISLGQQARLRTIRNADKVAAQMAADAGLDRAVYMLNQSLESGVIRATEAPSYSCETLAGSDATYTVSVDGDYNKGYEITSTGVCGNASETVRASVGLTDPTAQDYAILSVSQITLKNSSLVSGYNSSDSSDTDVAVRIGTTSTEDNSIIIGNNAVVNGDVYVGVDGDPDAVINCQSYGWNYDNNDNSGNNSGSNNNNSGNNNSNDQNNNSNNGNQYGWGNDNSDNNNSNSNGQDNNNNGNYDGWSNNSDSDSNSNGQGNSNNSNSNGNSNSNNTNQGQQNNSGQNNSSNGQGNSGNNGNNGNSGSGQGQGGRG